MAGDDDDRNAAVEDSGDDDENEVEDKSSSDDDQPQPRKMLTCNRLVNSINKLLDSNCFDPHDFGTVDEKEHETVLTGYPGSKKNPTTGTIL